MAETLQTPLESLACVGSLRGNLFKKLGLKRISDLIFFFPREYLEAADHHAYHQLQNDCRSSIVGTIDSIDKRFSPDGRSSVGVLLKVDNGGFVRLVWFNQPFRAAALERGGRIQATGVAKSTGISFEMRHPDVIKLDTDEEIAAGKPKPIYRLTEGLQQRHIIDALSAVLPTFADQLQDAFSADFLKQHNLLAIGEAIRQIHFPENLEQAHQARHRFVFQELLVYQLALAIRRSKLATRQAAPAIEGSGTIHHRILKRIGLQLTGDQQRVIEDIREDMKKPVAMNRLLQGDVGSGKTAVAQYAMLLAVANGYQATFMAPTEILARQHFERMKSSLSGAQCEVALLVGSLSNADKSDLQHQIALGTVDIVIGTQALLSDRVEFNKLGLVVIDEQHKFGVAQRATLRGSEFQPHYLVLSATPIPRSLAMTAFGDLDVSTIREKPAGRESVNTYLGSNEQMASWWQFVRSKVNEGRQAYVITPRVLSDEANEIAGAEQTFRMLRDGELAGLRIGLLHGKIDAAVKNETLQQFANGEIDVLVATTVVEVGIDVANATIMTILDANRLGLAQLHQLRGRINRGIHRGYLCVFASPSVDVTEQEKLVALSKIDDGFELAELDMKMRGPGNLIGTQQTGLPPFRIADLLRDRSVVEEVRWIAREMIANDSELSDPQWSRLKQQVVSRHGGMIDFGDVG